ncbi:MAG: prepilin-type N-terminal cleavage/methylation domain-containing protein [Bdellovibrionales bacterium]|nr:prepilin-type N-terminal cleavage/methylation domain-containing protein [Bdellovibrionales bacterium]
MFLLCSKAVQFRKHKKTTISGFTLIELMIVMSIIGIIASISYPAFQEYLRKAKYAEAYTFVGAINKAQQSYFLENNFFHILAFNPANNTLGAVEDKVSNTNLGKPLPVGQRLHGTYASYWGNTDDGGNEEIGIVSPGNYKISVTDELDLFHYSIDGGDCRPSIEFQNAGMSAVTSNPPNYYWVGTMASLNLVKGDEELGSFGYCTYIFQYIVFQNDQTLHSPFIAVSNE